ncbi:hypothetical protein [Paraburkholderia sp. SIMBA_030]|uniref:hypothetical protein n=1 Tax=Paraburkholderia sp. SIMBA_030 TaxID=3085773 RepID=UPI00397AF3DE
MSEFFKKVWEPLRCPVARIVTVSLKAIDPSEIRDQWSILGAFLCEALLYDGLGHQAAQRFADDRGFIVRK